VRAVGDRHLVDHALMARAVLRGSGEQIEGPVLDRAAAAQRLAVNPAVQRRLMDRGRGKRGEVIDVDGQVTAEPIPVLPPLHAAIPEAGPAEADVATHFLGELEPGHGARATGCRDPVLPRGTRWRAHSSFAFRRLLAVPRVLAAAHWS